MKKDIHPKLRPIIFFDASANKQFLIRSSLYTDQTAVYEEDNETYPMVNIDISSASHPIYTGKSRTNLKEGRIARFNNKFGDHMLSS